SHHQVMRLCAAAGQRAAAVRQYRELERILRQEFDAAPSAATQELLREISASDGRLQIRVPAQRAGDCKLQIANSSEAARTADRSPSTAAGAAGPDQSTIFNLQSSISNLPAWLESVGGALPLDSALYITRPAD